MVSQSHLLKLEQHRPLGRGGGGEGFKGGEHGGHGTEIMVVV